MRCKSEWAEFFNGHAPYYNENGFTRNTLAEVDFLIDELELPPGASILDVGCGTGRHSIELALRGFEVTGIDLSGGMLDQARKSAAAAQVEVRWIQADAVNFKVDRQVDAAICICEGAFGLLGSSDDPIEQPLAILRNIAAALKPGCRCLLTVLNGFALIRRYHQADVAKGQFDPLTMSERSECNVPGVMEATPLRERAFVPTELRLLFETAGLSVIAMWGGTAGNWGRRPIELDEMEIMVVAEKKQ